MSTTESSQTRAKARILWGVLIVVLAGTLGALIGTRLLWSDLVPRNRRTSDLPDYGSVGDFRLVDQSGRTVSKSDFDGRPWVADFIFTRCSGPCPLLTAQMARVADSLGTNSEVRFASFSVDPERDTPETLARYAETYGADPSHWLFLTGERRVISDLATQSFHLGMGDPIPITASTRAAGGDSSGAVETGIAGSDGIAEESGAETQAAYDIPHSLRFTLVDRDGRIRGYYDGTDDASLAKLYEDLALLLKASR